MLSGAKSSNRLQQDREKKVKVKRLTPTWTGHKFSSDSNK